MRAATSRWLGAEIFYGRDFGVLVVGCYLWGLSAEGVFFLFSRRKGTDELAAARISNKFPKDCNGQRVKGKD